MEEKKKHTKLILIIAIALVAIIVAVVIGMSVWGKKGENKEQKTTEKNYNIGETIKNDNFEMTLKSVEFVNFINLSTERDTKFKQNYYGTDRFCLSIDQEGDRKLTAEDEETILSYTLEYKYIGKKDYSTIASIGNPVVKYNNEYTFNTKYFSASNSGDGWIILDSDDTIRLNNVYWGSKKYKPLEDKNYLVRGFIILPIKVKNDIETPLTIRFNGLVNDTYKIR